MNIFDFVTPDQIDDLPIDDPRAAFTQFVRIASRAYNAHVGALDTNQEDSWREIEEARYGFMNVVIAAAKTYEIEEFSTREVPVFKNFNSDDHRQFRADLDHYVTQYVLDSSARGRRDSVFLQPDAKSDLRAYLHHMRVAIDGAEMSDGKRAALLAKLAEFEAELDKKRLSLVAVSLFAIAILSAPGGIATTIDVLPRMMGSILRAVGEAKAQEDDRRHLPPTAPPRAITGPRAITSVRATAVVTERSFNQDLDDEIPF